MFISIGMASQNLTCVHCICPVLVLYMFPDIIFGLSQKHASLAAESRVDRVHPLTLMGPVCPFFNLTINVWNRDRRIWLWTSDILVIHGGAEFGQSVCDLVTSVAHVSRDQNEFNCATQVLSTVYLLTALMAAWLSIWTLMFLPIGLVSTRCWAAASIAMVSAWNTVAIFPRCL